MKKETVENEWKNERKKERKNQAKTNKKMAEVERKMDDEQKYAYWRKKERKIERKKDFWRNR